MDVGRVTLQAASEVQKLNTPINNEEITKSLTTIETIIDSLKGESVQYTKLQKKIKRLTDQLFYDWSSKRKINRLILYKLKNALRKKHYATKDCELNLNLLHSRLIQDRAI
jgi:hypothetical protein